MKKDRNERIKRIVFYNMFIDFMSELDRKQRLKSIWIEEKIAAKKEESLLNNLLTQWND